MAQKFYASPRDTFTFGNGAIGHRSGVSFDCLGPYAKVRNCPIADTDGLRLTAYATGYADTMFSVPACTRHKGKYIGGFFAMRDNAIEFVPYNRFRHLLPIKAARVEIACGPRWRVPYLLDMPIQRLYFDSKAASGSDEEKAEARAYLDNIGKADWFIFGVHRERV